MRSSASFKVDFKIPERLDDATIQKLCKQWRLSGCTKSRDEIIKSHTRLALYLAGQYIKTNRRREDDLICQALLGVTQAVAWAPERMVDNNITPYIMATVKRFIRDFLEQDQLVTIERQAFKKMLESGESVQAIPYFRKIEEDERDEENPTSGYYEDCTTAIYDDYFDKEFYQYLHRNNTRLIAILDGLIEGYTFQEIADKLGITKQYVSVLLLEVKDRVTLWKRKHL